MKRHQIVLLPIALVVALAACTVSAPPTPTGSVPATPPAGHIHAAMDQARKELETENFTLRTKDGMSSKAEITPAGDFLIDGKPVPVDAHQRQLLLAYRARLVAIGIAGMDVGAAGVDLAARAVGEAIRGIFSGDGDKVGKRIEAQADGVRRAAMKICDLLPALMQSQKELSDALPAFRPYAKVRGDDNSKCRNDAADGAHGPRGAAVGGDWGGDGDPTSMPPAATEGAVSPGAQPAPQAATPPRP